MKLGNDNLEQVMQVEHYRLHLVEGWPDSPHKQAVLSAIRSTLERLKAASPACVPMCLVCASRRREAAVLQFPSPSQVRPGIVRVAA
jgi:hypothetical protein